MIDLIKDLNNKIESKIDRSKWQKWKFSDLVENINEKIVPKDSGLAHYIGLEHLDSGTLHIKRFGETSSLIGEKLKIYKDDIIFAKRNAYLKRVAVANFDAVASAHSLVLRAKSKNIVPEFLPFFLLTEVFWKKAIEISVGSLSPTINWPILAKQEFILPSEDQQVELSNLLRALDKLLESERKILEHLQDASHKVFEQLVNESEGYEVELSKVLIPKKNKSSPPHKIEKYIGLEHVESGAFNCKSFGYSIDAIGLCNVVESGDLCYSKLRPYLDKAFIADFSSVATTELLVYKTVLATELYVLYHLHSNPFIDYVSSQGFGTKMPRVSHEIIGKYKIKVLKDEKKVLESMKKFELSKQAVIEKINSTNLLLKSLINKVF